MDPRFRPHNTHLEDPDAFAGLDPHLRLLSDRALVHRSVLMDHLPVDAPGIYSITGGRQVGKTTVLKQWMAELLEAGTQPERIAYLTGELIDDHDALVRHVSDVLRPPARGHRYVLLDEVTYIRDWDKGVKYLADAGLLRDVILILTGSDSVIIREARMRFPGRRGRSATVDFHLFPLTLSEYIVLKKVARDNQLTALVGSREDADPRLVRRLLEAFESYLLHGGYLTAINDLETDGTITAATFATYSDWIRGDVLKRGKQEHYLREVLLSVIRRQGSQVTWNALAKELSIDHPATVADYVALLERMDVLCVQPALREDALSGAPKKARKVSFTDPFICHAVRSWLEPCDDPFALQAQPSVLDPDSAGRLAEATVASHFARFFPTYYIKSTGEVDVAYVSGRRFWPVEVKWTRRLRPHDLKQIRKYRKGVICTRSDATGEIEGVRTEPLPLVLLRLGPSPVTMQR